MSVESVAPPRGVRGLKSEFVKYIKTRYVAPPRGVRGLKFFNGNFRKPQLSRTPSWGAWIEMKSNLNMGLGHSVAPPRGVRGLKYYI